MPPRYASSRWLDHLEETAIIDFIRCNPGRNGREIAEYLGLPKRSVNGFLYKYGIQHGVENLDYRWYPLGLVIDPEPCPIGPGADPEPLPRRPNPPPAPKPEWTDEPEPIETTVVKAEPVNLAPVNKQSGWSRMGCLYAGLFVVAVLLLAKAATGAELVRVRSCYDGDTCTLNTGEKVRLACFDTPELRGRSTGPMVSIHAAIAARDHLRQMVVGREVSIQRHTTDRYGRTVATLFIDGRPVGAEMVRSGHAVVMPRYAHQCSWSR